MLISLAIIFIGGLALGQVFKKFRLPMLIGMIIVGILVGPNMFNLLDDKILSISTELRQLALIIILTRAGLALDIRDLKKAGKSAIFMCFLPATFEIIGVVLIAPRLLGVSVIEAAIMGAVIAAVSPAVIVPKMLNLMKEKYGTDKSVPQVIMAGASVDDIYAIVLFTAFVGLAKGGEFSAISLIQVPISIVFGIIFGILLGFCVVWFFKKYNINLSVRVVLMLSLAFICVYLEEILKGIVPFSGLIAIMAVGAVIYKKFNTCAKELSDSFSSLWVGAEIILFVLVGAKVDIKYAVAAGVSAVLVILGVLVVRMLGVYCCFLGSDLNMKERLFCMMAYTPKATVQAAIGGLPLAYGLACGNIVLTVALVSILITAPFGAFAIDLSYKKLLKKEG